MLEFIMKRGSDTWVTLANGELMPKLEQLEEFAYIDEKGHDQVAGPPQLCPPSCPASLRCQRMVRTALRTLDG